MKRTAVFLLICVLCLNNLVFADARQDFLNTVDPYKYVINAQNVDEVREVIYGHKYHVHYRQSEASIIWMLADYGYFEQYLTSVRLNKKRGAGAELVDSTDFIEALLEYHQKFERPEPGYFGVTPDGYLCSVQSVSGDQATVFFYRHSDDTNYGENEGPVIYKTYPIDQFIGGFFDPLSEYERYMTAENGYIPFKGAYVKGNKSGDLMPSKLVTRAEFLVMLFRILEIQPEASNGPAKFSDIKGHWAYDYIQSSHKLGLINGFKDGTFRPNDSINAAQLAKIIDAYWQKSGYQAFVPEKPVESDTLVDQLWLNVQEYSCALTGSAWPWRDIINRYGKPTFRLTEDFWAYPHLQKAVPLIAPDVVLTAKRDAVGQRYYDINQNLTREQVAASLNLLTFRYGIGIGKYSQIKMASLNVDDLGVISHQMWKQDWEMKERFDKSSLKTR